MANDRNPKLAAKQGVSDIRILVFGFVSSFVLRISNLNPAESANRIYVLEALSG